MPILTIESATALIGREQRDGETRETQLLEIAGRTEDGRVARACLVFSPAVARARTSPVGYVSADDDGGLMLVGWLPEGDYPAYREVLMAGGALQVHFETRDRTSGYLRRIALGRGAAALVSTSHARSSGRDAGPIAYAMPL